MFLGSSLSSETHTLVSYSWWIILPGLENSLYRELKADSSLLQRTSFTLWPNIGNTFWKLFSLWSQPAKEEILSSLDRREHGSWVSFRFGSWSQRLQQDLELPAEATICIYRIFTIQKYLSMTKQLHFKSKYVLSYRKKILFCERF